MSVKSVLRTTLGVAAKTVGLGISIAGLSAFAAYKVVSWPVRKLLNSQRGAVVAKSQEDGPASFIDNPYVKVMLLMGMPAVASVMQFASRKMMEQTDLNLAVAERAMQKVSQAAMPLQLVCGPITAAAKNVEPNTGDTTLLLTFGIFDLQTNQELTSNASCRLVMQTDSHASRVHAFYERPSDGKVIDIYLNADGEDLGDGTSNGGASSGAARNVVADAEVVEPASSKDGDNAAQRRQ